MKLKLCAATCKLLEKDTIMRICRCIIFTLFCGIEMLLFVGCGEKNITADSTGTDKLKICISESAKSIYLDSVIPIYEKENPEVEIEWEFISLGQNVKDQTDERDRIASELMAGDGADLYFNVETFLGDLYKAQETGCFADLIPLLKEYTQFQENDFISGTFDVLEDGEECYVLPVVNSFPVTMIQKSMEADLGIDVNRWNSIADYCDGVQKFYEKYPEEVPFLINDDGLLGIDYYGFEIWEKEKNYSVLRSPEWKKNLELMKRWLYPEGTDSGETANWDNTQYEQDMDSFARGESIHFVKNTPNVRTIEDYIRMGGEAKAELVPVYDIDGKIRTNAIYSVAIAASSENKKEAMLLIKTMLENMGITMLKADSEKVLDDLREQFEKREVVINGEVYAGLTETTFSKLEEWMDQSVAGCYIPVEVNNQLNDNYEKFWKGEISYEQCIEQCINYMKIYYSE